MTRLKDVALLGVILGSVGTTYGSILEAQCRARCHTSLHMSWGESYRLSCSNSTNCSSCVTPCSTEYKTLSLCKAKCQSSTETSWCLSSCEFLKLNHNRKRGHCPPPEDITGFGKACAETCSNDSQCNGLDKCCYNGCGHTCQQPVVNKNELPPKPRNSPTVTENDNGQSVTIRWELRSNGEEQPGVILYIIQGRNNTGHHPSARHMDEWADLTITDEMEYIADLSLGNFYRFQVAAVNENGSLGFCKPTSPFRLSRTPQAPSAPVNLREGQSTATSGRINLRVIWDPPKTSDLTVTRYRVYYSERRSTVSPFYFPIEEHSRNVPGDQLDVTLEDLHPDMKYFIQVQAISQWGDARKRSDRISLVVWTMDLHPPGDSPPVLVPIEEPSRSGDTPGEPRDVRPEEPYWESGSLKCSISWKKPKGFETTVNRFTIHWQPMGCANDHTNGSLTASTHANEIFPQYPATGATTHDRKFDIYDLMFDCQYRVSIVAVSDSLMTSPESNIRFYTPPCQELRIKGQEKPVCPTPLPDIPSKPVNISYIFMLSDSNITAQFMWAPPLFSLYPVIGYRVMWAEHRQVSGTLFGEGFPLLGSMENLILPATKQAYAIPRLKSGTRYRVQIQALTDISGGAMAFEDIKTPKIQANPQPPTSVPPPLDETEHMSTHNPTEYMAGHSGTTSWHAVSRTSRCLALALCCLLFLILR